jgi:hypothetical protein
MRGLALLLLLAPAAALADAAVLVDAVPSDGVLFGMSPVGMPFRDAEASNPKDISEGLSAAVSAMIPGATQKGISFICLLSSPGDNPVEAFIKPANATLRLRRRNTTLTAVFYTGGHPSPLPMVYAAGDPPTGKSSVKVKFDKIAVPPGVTTAGWVYFNLPRIQGSAEKAAAPEVFLRLEGTGSSSAMAIPGMKEPMIVHDDHAALTAVWYDPTLRRGP